MKAGDIFDLKERMDDYSGYRAVDIIDNQNINFVEDHKLIPPASYEDGEEWVQQYHEQFGMEPSFF